jgi:peptide/nickel transport system substrate-binding protein
VRRSIIVAVPLLALALLVPASGATRTAKDGGTFRVGADAPNAGTIDPAAGIPGLLQMLRPTCGTLMGYPDKRLPAGLVLGPELAESDPIVADDGKTYTFTIRKNARFSTGAPVLARDFVHALERVLDPKLNSGYATDFSDVVGARRLLAGNATSIAGAVASGRELVVKLTERVSDFPARTTELCAVPANLPDDPEGARAPLASAAPYFVASFVPGERLVLERNTFYMGSRTHHVDRIDVDLAADPATLIDDVASGKFDYAPSGPWFGGRERELIRRYGVNKSQLFVLASPETHIFVLNTSRPLFRNNLELRRAVNFAIDRHALVATEINPFVETPTDQYLPPTMPGYRNAHIYPLKGPDLRRARALARGHTRSGKAVLYTCSEVFCIGPAQIVQQSLKKIGIAVRIRAFPTAVQLEKMATRGEPFDIGRIWFGAAYSDPAQFFSIFDGRNVGGRFPATVNFSRFDSPRFNMLLDRAGKLVGPARYRAYGDLDVQLARRAAPAIPYSNFNEFTFVSPNVGCVIPNPYLDLTAVCLK